MADFKIILDKRKVFFQWKLKILHVLYVLYVYRVESHAKECETSAGTFSALEVLNQLIFV